MFSCLLRYLHLIQWADEYPECSKLTLSKYFEPGLLKEMEEYMGEEVDLIPFYFLRAYKAALTMSTTPNYNFIVNSNGSFLSKFFNKLVEVLSAENEPPYAVLNTIAIFLKFLLKSDAICFQAFFLVFNLPFLLLPYISSNNILDILLTPMLPSVTVCENNEEALNRYMTYCKLSSFFDDLAIRLYSGKRVEIPKQKMGYKPMYLGEISKVIASYGTGGLLDTHDSPLEEKYSVLEERRSIKTDIDLILRHFNEMARRKNVLFRMRSTMNFDIDKNMGFQIEKARFPEIFKKLKESKDQIIFVDYEAIKDTEIYPKDGKARRSQKPQLRSRSPAKSRKSKSPGKLNKLVSDESSDSIRLGFTKRNSLPRTLDV